MMRRSSTRRTGVLPSTATVSTRSGNKAALRELEKIDTFFSQYVEKFDETSIGPDGIEALCEDLAVSPTGIRVLLLAWNEGNVSRQCGQAEEGNKRCEVCRILGPHIILVSSQYLFKDFYLFAFQYCLTEPCRKTLDLESSCQMLELVLGPRARVPSFLQFLQEQTEYKAMNMDQWTAFLRFCEELEIKPDLSNYDESQAWPLLLDNYVEWARKCTMISL
ncbi:unnamed protein product [Sphagnum jensenii]|uniref:Defective in cullin neddylation protein n=1 Tax=Sphagnum jensenii TaxID=128206 RepID=A0ABP0X896_9BRYO